MLSPPYMKGFLLQPTIIFSFLNDVMLLGRGLNDNVQQYLKLSAKNLWDLKVSKYTCRHLWTIPYPPKNNETS